MKLRIAAVLVSVLVAPAFASGSTPALNQGTSESAAPVTVSAVAGSSEGVQKKVIHKKHHRSHKRHASKGSLKLNSIAKAKRSKSIN